MSDKMIFKDDNYEIYEGQDPFIYSPVYYYWKYKNGFKCQTYFTWDGMMKSMEEHKEGVFKANDLEDDLIFAGLITRNL